jgi:mannose-6-phosphate isomerase-like protein (cupin superfamily)
MDRTAAFTIHEDDCELEGWPDPETGQARWRTLISSDRTPTDSLTVGVAELEPGDSRAFCLHRHAQAEVYYILAGEGIVTISGTDHLVRSGTAIFVPGGVEHGVRNTGAGPLRLLYLFPASSLSEIEYRFPTS